MSIVDETYGAGAQFRVTLLGEWNGAEEVQNVFEMFMVNGTGVAGADVLDDLLEYFDDFCNLLDNVCSILTIWRGIRVQELDGLNTTGEIPFTAPIPGAITGDSLPPGVAMLINFNTGVAHRNLKKYFGVAGEAQVESDGSWASGTVTGLGVLATYLLAPKTMTHQIWEYSHNAGPELGVLFPSSASIPVAPAYQRRRKQNVGI